MCTFVRNFVLAVLSTSPYSINAGGELLSLEEPVVMGILNATPDSFYKHEEGAEALAHHALQMLEEGASILDVGACSTRPGFTPPDEEEEMRRLKEALSALRKVAPKAILSVDTFRASVAKMCVEGFGVQMVNDISGGELDKEMFKTVAELGVPYILTHNANLDETEDAPFMAAFLREMGGKVEALHELGVCDIILDPGFGFGKTLEQNYILMRNLEVLHELNLPLLVGVSHKSMIYKLLNVTPDEALNGTTALQTVALEKGAHILRAHEVREAVECVKIINKLSGCLI
ncbi:MAG: dihydropteroate synthase [Bacteroidaceae bacterium]|nr:dihydropteroate synthase [Bacteroidaceae bacterium]